MKLGRFVPLATAAAVVSVATLVQAAVTFDPFTGTGFVGKGTVQSALGINNKGLQGQADSLEFAAESITITEVSWICTNSNNQNTQERERTTTISKQGVVAATLRERNQITGFILTGYSGSPTIISGTPEGPALNSCPGGPWSLSTPAGDPVVLDSETTLTVDGVAL
jgi:hypothetical protein